MAQTLSETRKDRLVSILSDRITRSTGYLETKDSMERERVLMYYNGELPKPQNYGNSKFVSNDVFDSVESMKSQLLETFTGTFTPVTFLPDSAQDVPEAKVATTLTNNAVMVQNDGFEIFEDVIHDGLLGRMGIVKVTWETSEEVNEVSFEEPSDDELAAHFAQNPDSDVMDAETDPDTGAIQSLTLKSSKHTPSTTALTLRP